jgi:hypothetical protein
MSSQSAATLTRLAEMSANAMGRPWWECAVVEAAHGWDSAAQNGRVDGQVHQKSRAEAEGGQQDGRQGEREDEPVEQPAVGLGVFASAEGLGDEGVEPEEDAGDTEAQGVEEDLGERGRGHRKRGVGQMAEHDGVDQRHGHPSQLAGDERESEPEQRRQLAADVVDANAHG